jgi:flagellar motility protein MotE (MotC chaperone)
MFATALASLLSIAVTLGLSRAVDTIDYIKASKENLNADDVIKASQTMINEARKKGSNIMDKLTERFESIQLPFSASSAVKDFVIRQRNAAKDKLDKAKKDISDVEQTLNTAEQRANNFTYQPDSVKWKQGYVVNEIKNDVQDQINKLNSVEETINAKK